MMLCKSLGHNKGNQNNVYNNLLKVQKTTHQGETIANCRRSQNCGTASYKNGIELS